MDALLIHFTMKFNVAAYEPDHSRPVIGGCPSRASLDSDNYSLLHYKKNDKQISIGNCKTLSLFIRERVSGDWQYNRSTREAALIKSNY